MPAAACRRSGNQRIVVGDCLAVLAQDTGIADIDVVVTSPPYNLGLDYPSYGDDRPEEAYLDWLEAVAASVVARLAPDGSFFLNISASGNRPWLPFMVAARFRRFLVLQNHICWIKSVSIGGDTAGHFKPISGQRFLHQNHEHIFHFTRTGQVRLDRLAIGLPFKDKSNIARRGHARDLKCRGNTWFIPYKTVQSRAEKFHHPATFPLLLPLWCIYLHGKPQPRVLDPFAGVGTTLLACQMAGGCGVGIDREAAYTDVAKARLDQAAEDGVQVRLDAAETTELLKPDLAAGAGLRAFLGSLQDKLNKTTGLLPLSGDDLARIPRYAAAHGTLWHDRLGTVFGRHLGPSLDQRPC